MAKQHIQIPHDMTTSHPKLISPKELLAYASIRRCQSGTDPNREVFPSLDTIAKQCGCSKPTAVRMVHNLESAGYIKIRKECAGSKARNYYTIVKTPNHFERFDFSLLDDKTLSADDKATILTLQQEMLNKNEGISILPIRKNDVDLCKIMNCSPNTLKKRYKSLMEKGILNITTTTDRDYTGLPIAIKEFNMKINMIAVELADQDERITQLEKDKQEHISNTEKIAQLEKRAERFEQLEENLVKKGLL
jgi:DNA-binding transcriptional regulator YhcF (GntR family)